MIKREIVDAVTVADKPPFSWIAHSYHRMSFSTSHLSDEVKLRFYENGYRLKKAAVDGDNSIAQELERICKICIERSCPRAHTDRSQEKEGTPYQGQWCLRRGHCYIRDHDWHLSKVMFSIAVKTICAPSIDGAQSTDLSYWYLPLYVRQHSAQQ